MFEADIPYAELGMFEADIPYAELGMFEADIPYAEPIHMMNAHTSPHSASRRFRSPSEPPTRSIARVLSLCASPPAHTLSLYCWLHLSRSALVAPRPVPRALLCRLMLALKVLYKRHWTNLPIEGRGGGGRG